MVFSGVWFITFVTNDDDDNDDDDELECQLTVKVHIFQPPVVSRTSSDSRDSMQASGMSGGVSGAMLSGQRSARGGARGPSVRGMVRNDRGGSARGNFNEDTG